MIEDVLSTISIIKEDLKLKESLRDEMVTQGLYDSSHRLSIEINAIKSVIEDIESSIY